MISTRSVVRPATALLKKYDRWRTIIREAAEQCERGRLPELIGPLTWPDAVAHAQGMRLFPWEAARNSRGLGDILVTQEIDKVSLLIGPEGGIAQDEADLAQSVGWQVVSLGPRILRAETAAIVSTALIMDCLGQMG